MIFYDLSNYRLLHFQILFSIYCQIILGSQRIIIIKIAHSLLLPSEWLDEPWNRRKDVMTFSIEIVKEGFISKKYTFSGRYLFIIILIYERWSKVRHGSHGFLFIHRTLNG